MSETVEYYSVKTYEDAHKKWIDISNTLEYAFQPIVNIHTGFCHGMEALIRNFTAAGFSSIHDMFDQAFVEKKLYHFISLLLEKALVKYVNLPFHAKSKLFYNIDNRILLMPDYSRTAFQELMDSFTLSPDSVCFEISERHEANEHLLHDTTNVMDIKATLDHYKRSFYKIALDDFGSGLSGLQLLYHAEPDYVKIDRFFINGIATDARKKLYISSTVQMAHILGIMVIAEGVETKEEFYACKEIGCDFVQGYLVQYPTIQTHELSEKMKVVIDLNQADKRNVGTDQDLIFQQMDYVEPIPLYKDNESLVDMQTVFEAFRRHKVHSFFPVINTHNEPVGVIREKDLKEYVYSPFGKNLLQNKSSGNIKNFISKIPISEIKTKIEHVLEVFSHDVNSEGVLLTENGKYVGFLSASSLIKLLNEKNLSEARDQNPLTKLPGNTIINQHIAEIMQNEKDDYVLVYFDFDNFKPFNDKYGFRQGDRAILIFADILKDVANKKKVFVAHVGGDDFFAAFRIADVPYIEILDIIKSIIERFSNDVMSIYSKEDRKRGHILSTNRDGQISRFDLLGVSAGVIKIPAGHRHFSMEDMFTVMASMKSDAKKSNEKYMACTMHE